MVKKRSTMYTIGTTWHGANSSRQGAGNRYAPVIITGASITESDRLSIYASWLRREAAQSEVAGRYQEAIVLRTKAQRMAARALSSLSDKARARLDSSRDAIEIQPLAPLDNPQAAYKPGMDKRLWQEQSSRQLLGEYHDSDPKDY